MRKIWWSADLTLPGCPTHEAEPCSSGWIDPDWSVFEVGPDRDRDAVPTVMPDGTENPAVWLAETVGARIGVPDGCHHTDRPGAWVAADAAVDITSGLHSRVRAAAEGFALTEMVAANQLLLGRGPDEPCCL